MLLHTFRFEEEDPVICIFCTLTGATAAAAFSHLLRALFSRWGVENSIYLHSVLTNQWIIITCSSALFLLLPWWTRLWPRPPRRRPRTRTRCLRSFWAASKIPPSASWVSAPRRTPCLPLSTAENVHAMKLIQARCRSFGLEIILLSIPCT